MPKPPATPGHVYWDAVARAWRASPWPSPWRAYWDESYRRLFAGWLAEAAPVGRLLKTDAFEEAHGRGLVSLLARQARTVVAIDVSPLIVGQAVAREPDLVALAADVRRLPFATATFDTVVSTSTLDHFATSAEIDAALGELARVLRPGGELLLTLDNGANPAVALRNALPFAALRRVGLLPYFVGATYGPGGLRASLERNGFRVVELRTVMHCPRLLGIALARLLERRPAAARRRFVAALLELERLSGWPTARMSGYFVAARARRS